MIEKITLVLAMLILMAGIFYQGQNPQAYKKDCQLAEISTDFTVEERNQCRKMRKS